MNFDILYEVVDLRSHPKAPLAATLHSVPGGVSANYYSGRDEFFSLDDDDALEIDGTQITLHTDDGEVVFLPMESDADALEMIGVYDLGLLQSYCEMAV